MRSLKIENEWMNLPHNELLAFFEVKHFYVAFLDPIDFEGHLNEHQIFWCLIYCLHSSFLERSVLNHYWTTTELQFEWRLSLGHSSVTQCPFYIKLQFISYLCILVQFDSSSSWWFPWATNASVGKNTANPIIIEMTCWNPVPPISLAFGKISKKMT